MKMVRLSLGRPDDFISCGVEMARQKPRSQLDNGGSYEKMPRKAPIHVQRPIRYSIDDSRLLEHGVASRIITALLAPWTPKRQLMERQ